MLFLCKKLRDEGLHIFKGMMGYCMKDIGKEHLKFIHHNVSIYEMSEHNLEYANSGKIGSNSCVYLSHSNIFKELTNGYDSICKNNWVSCYLERCITCARAVNFIGI